MAKPHRALAALSLACAAIAAAPEAKARITRVEITETTAAFDGQSFGSGGRYERLRGRAFGEVDPAHPGNAIIQDIALAPRNARGMVEYETEIDILRPVEATRGNGVLLFDIVNRGNRRLLSLYNGATRVDNTDPGDGMLMRRGYTLVFFGWQPDLTAGDNRVTMRVPVARNADGSPITGVVRSEIVVQAAAPAVNLSSGNFTQLFHTSYPTASRDNRTAGPDGFLPRLTVRTREADARQEIPNDRWSFADCRPGQAPQPSDTQICLDGGFQPGRLYELVYRGKDPLVLGLGYAAMRDLPAFMRHARTDDAGQANPIYRDGTVTLVHGTSQSGRNMRLFLHLGFNRDEAGRRAYDGMLPHVGGGLAAMNIRFAHPGRAWGEQIDHLYPAYDFPFAYARVTDPITGRTASVLDRCEATNTCPRIIHAATALEVWEGRQSLGLTDPLGERDLPDLPNVRTFIMGSTQHSTGSDLHPTRLARPTLCEYPSNPNTHLQTMRALLVALTDWVQRDVPPPASVHPRIADGTLVRPDQVRFPAVPGVAFRRTTNPLRVMEFGPGYNPADLTGIISTEPPAEGTREYTLLVPQVDADGNDLGGVRSLGVQVPRATLTGWNYFREDRFGGGGFCNLQGSAFPFAATRAERVAANDPRPSLEERYPTREAYVAALRQAASRLIAQRLLLEEDAATAIAAAERDGPVALRVP
ncbi:alpha/beta hydrolase domain-containing protein [Roseomonas sp. CAU 1739]|uniref:alpha/beta hydrolase domain-containing protein n=1 Tax=Roseomonas sp. CAU 1739 TaxID=3140364 RepID=UPI00325BAFC4